MMFILTYNGWSITGATNRNLKKKKKKKNDDMSNQKNDKEKDVVASAVDVIVMQPENGKIYVVKHRRKGTFKIFVESQTDEWLTGLIIEGTADAILDYNRREQFEKITIRKSFCSFNEFA